MIVLCGDTFSLYCKSLEQRASEKIDIIGSTKNSRLILHAVSKNAVFKKYCLSIATKDLQELTRTYTAARNLDWGSF